MASTINAISTGAGGIATSADSSGILQLQTNDTTAITVNASQVVSLANALPIASGGTGLTAVGTSGNILTSNGTSWVSTAPAAAGSGGTTTITGSVTLTSSSAASMTVTPTSPGLYVTLPSATTCSEGAILFSIFNAGDYDYGIKNSAGTQLGWVLPGTNSIVGLSDNSTAAGIWNISNLCKTGVTAKSSSLLASLMPYTTIALDSNRTLIFSTNASTSWYAVIYDASTLTWGSYTLIRSTTNISAGAALLIASNTVLFSSSTATTAMETVVLSISGTTITVNTAVSTTLTGNFNGFGSHYRFGGSLIAVGTSYVLLYNRSTPTPSTCLRSITVSGTVPTVGAETLITPNDLGGYCRLFSTGSVVRVLTSIATQVTISPYTVSGTTLTVGTGAYVTAGSVVNKAFQNDAGNIIVFYPNSTNDSVVASIFKLTGTTEAVSTSTIPALGGTFYGQYLDFYYISPTKTAIVWWFSNTGKWGVNILTDTNGSASVGTSLTGTLDSVTNGATLNTTTVNNMKVVFNSLSGDLLVNLIDCSGTSPVLISATQHHPVLNQLPINGVIITPNEYAPYLPISDFEKSITTKKPISSLVIGDSTILLGAYRYGRNLIYTKNGLISNSIPNYGAFGNLLYIGSANLNQTWSYDSNFYVSSLSLIEGAAV